MAKGFDKTITNNKLSRYAPLTKRHKSLIRSFEAMTDSVYGEDFFLHNRLGTIYIKKNLSPILEDIKKHFESLSQTSTLESFQKVLERMEVVDSIDEAEFGMLFTEAVMWQAYKLLHNGDEPRIEKDLCFYSEEEIDQISQKIDEMAVTRNSAEENIEEIVRPFLKYLKNQGYFYHFTHYKMIARD